MKDSFAVLFGLDAEMEPAHTTVHQPSLFETHEKSENADFQVGASQQEETLSKSGFSFTLKNEPAVQISLKEPLPATTSQQELKPISQEVALAPVVVSSWEKKLKTDWISWVQPKTKSAFSPSFSKKTFHFFDPKVARKRVKEAKAVVVIFLVILSWFYFFTNAQLVFYTFYDVFASANAVDLSQISETLVHNAAGENKEERLSQLESRFEEIQKQVFSGEQLALGMEEFIATEDSHAIDYNILPPTNRLIIPDLNINVPLIDAEANGRVDFSNEDFDDELTKWVVKYPTTPTPGQNWNTLLFGHTSTERWKKNAYGVVFRNIPKLKIWQRFQIIWNGQLTTYEMVERKVVLPKNVEEYYNLFADKDESYVTLMGCYPIGTANQRMMVVAKKVEG